MSTVALASCHSSRVSTVYEWGSRCLQVRVHSAGKLIRATGLHRYLTLLYDPGLGKSLLPRPLDSGTIIEYCLWPGAGKVSTDIVRSAVWLLESPWDR